MKKAKKQILEEIAQRFSIELNNVNVHSPEFRKEIGNVITPILEKSYRAKNSNPRRNVDLLMDYIFSEMNQEDVGNKYHMGKTRVRQIVERSRRVMRYRP